MDCGTLAFTDSIGGTKKYVVSGSLTDPTWANTTAVPGDPDRIRAIKEQTAGDVTMSGSATTVRWLLANGLLDELSLLVHPIVVGSGQRFGPAERQATGIRNAVAIEVAPDGQLWVAQHGRDQLDTMWPGMFTAEQNAELPAEEEYQNEEGQTIRTVKEESGTLIELRLGEDVSILDLQVPPSSKI